MSILSNQDVENLLSAVVTLHSDIDPATLHQRTLSAVNQVIASDYISFDWFSRPQINPQKSEQYDSDFDMPNMGLVHLLESWYDYEFNLTPDELEVADKYSHETPLFDEVWVKKAKYPVKITDFVSAREYYRTTIYNECFRHYDSNYGIGVMLPMSSDIEISCCLGRTKRDFSEEDRVRLAFLAPHLASAIKNSRAVNQLQTNKANLETALETEQNALIVLSRHGNILFATDYADDLLKKYYADEKISSSALPENLRRAVEQIEILEKTDDFSFQPIFVVKGENGELHIKIVTNSVNGEKLLLLDEKRRLTPKNLEPLGLTKREAEVLYWTAMGKGDFEIAALCGISIRTIQKHNEQIFRKMGVENRTAAVLRMMEVLGLMKKIFF